MAGGHDRAESGTAAPGTRCTTVDGVTLEVTVASDFVRVRVRRSAGRAGSVASWGWAILSLALLCVLTAFCVALAVLSWRPGPLAREWLAVAFLVFLLTVAGPSTLRDVFHRLCGEDEVELRAGSATVRRRSAISVEERSFPCADEVIGLRVEFVSWFVRMLEWKDPPRGLESSGPLPRRVDRHGDAPVAPWSGSVRRPAAATSGATDLAEPPDHAFPPLPGNSRHARSSNSAAGCPSEAEP